MPDGPPPPPVAQRLRIRYAKRGRLRFTSHRDIQRAFERALRRAGVPMAFSAGFSPHPKISWAGAAPTGTASEAEYVEIAVTAPLDPHALRIALDAALPPDLDILEILEAGGGSLVDRLEASVWRIELPGAPTTSVAEAIAGFLAAPRVEVQRLTKTGMRTFDARGAVLALELERASGHTAPDEPGRSGSSACAILRVVVRHATPAVRPDDVLIGLGSVAGLVSSVPPRVTRLAQGPLIAETEVMTGTGAWSVADPMAPDRTANADSGSSGIEAPIPGV